MWYVGTTNDSQNEHIAVTISAISKPKLLSLRKAIKQDNENSIEKKTANGFRVFTKNK